MAKRSVNLLAMLVLLAGCAAPAQVVVEVPGSHPDVAVKTAVPHTLLMTEGCTAVSVGSGFVLTAEHCVHGSELGDSFSVGLLVMTSLSTGRVGDWALLFNPDSVNDEPICMRAPVFGEHIYSVGYPGWRHDGEQRLTVQDGLVAAAEAVSVDYGDGMSYVNLLRYSVPTDPGNSGGGLWAEDGCLVGLTSGGFRNTHEHYMTVMPVL